MKIILFFVLAGLVGIISLAMWLNHRQNSLYPRADFAIVPKDLTPLVANRMVFVYKDLEVGYTVNVNNMAFDPATQQAILGGRVTESSDPSLPTGSYTIIYVQGNQNFWQNFPSIQTLVVNKSDLN